MNRWIRRDNPDAENQAIHLLGGISTKVNCVDFRCRNALEIFLMHCDSENLRNSPSYQYQQTGELLDFLHPDFIGINSSVHFIPNE